MLINKIVIGCDHAGFALKEQIKQYLDAQGVEMLDVGCYSTMLATIQTLHTRFAPRSRAVLTPPVF